MKKKSSVLYFDSFPVNQMWRVCACLTADCNIEIRVLRQMFGGKNHWFCQQRFFCELFKRHTRLINLLTESKLNLQSLTWHSPIQGKFSFTEPSRHTQQGGFSISHYWRNYVTPITKVYLSPPHLHPEPHHLPCTPCFGSLQGQWWLPGAAWCHRRKNKNK